MAPDYLNENILRQPLSGGAFDGMAHGSAPLSYAHVSDMLAERKISVHRSRPFIVGLSNMRLYSVKNSKNINLVGLFPPGNSIKPTSKSTVNDFTFTVQLINTGKRWMFIFHRNVIAMPPINFSNGYYYATAKSTQY